MAVNRVAGLVLPYTSKTLLDKVLSPHESACCVACRDSLLSFFRP